MSNAILTVLDRLEEKTDVVKHIVSHDVAGQYSEDVYGNLARDCVSSGCLNKKQWEDWLSTFEDEVLLMRESAGENVRTKGGKFKRSKVSATSTYRSNKSVLGSALEKGILILDSDGKPKPKSQLEKEIKGEIVDGVTVKKTAYERALAATTTLIKLYSQLTETEQDDIVSRLERLGLPL